MGPVVAIGSTIGYSNLAIGAAGVTNWATTMQRI